MTKLQVIFYEILRSHLGEANVIKRENVLYEINRKLPSNEIMSDRTMREVKRSLKGKVISNLQGYFIPVCAEELLRYKEYLRKKAIPILENWTNASREYEHLLNSGQMEFNLKEKEIVEEEESPSGAEVSQIIKNMKINIAKRG